jgi:hypothetical protein
LEGREWKNANPNWRAQSGKAHRPTAPAGAEVQRPRGPAGASLTGLPRELLRKILLGEDPRANLGKDRLPLRDLARVAVMCKQLVCREGFNAAERRLQAATCAAFGQDLLELILLWLIKPWNEPENDRQADECADHPPDADGADADPANPGGPQEKPLDLRGGGQTPRFDDLQAYSLVRLTASAERLLKGGQPESTVSLVLWRDAFGKRLFLMGSGGVVVGGVCWTCVASDTTQPQLYALIQNNAVAVPVLGLLLNAWKRTWGPMAAPRGSPQGFHGGPTLQPTTAPPAEQMHRSEGQGAGIPDVKLEGLTLYLDSKGEQDEVSKEAYDTLLMVANRYPSRDPERR